MTEVAKIRQLQAQQVRQLRQLFRQGLASDFDYFPRDYLNAVDRANSAPRLLLAVIRPSRLILIAQQGRKLVGYTITGFESPGEAFLYWVYVDPKIRGHRVGRRLMAETLSRLKQRNIQKVRLATHDYVDYYRRYGFKSRPEQSFSIGPTKMYIMELQF